MNSLPKRTNRVTTITVKRKMPIFINKSYNKKLKTDSINRRNEVNGGKSLRKSRAKYFCSRKVAALRFCNVPYARNFHMWRKKIHIRFEFFSNFCPKIKIEGITLLKAKLNFFSVNDLDLLWNFYDFFHRSDDSLGNLRVNRWRHHH